MTDWDKLGTCMICSSLCMFTRLTLPWISIHVQICKRVHGIYLIHTPVSNVGSHIEMTQCLLFFDLHVHLLTPEELNVVHSVCIHKCILTVPNNSHCVTLILSCMASHTILDFRFDRTWRKYKHKLVYGWIAIGIGWLCLLMMVINGKS